MKFGYIKINYFYFHRQNVLVPKKYLKKLKLPYSYYPFSIDTINCGCGKCERQTVRNTGAGGQVWRSGVFFIKEEPADFILAYFHV